jgi:RNA polymerase sigma-70 factor (ECF subfamily)
VTGAHDPNAAFEPARLILSIAASGDREAFAALFRHFAPRVKGYLLKLGATSAAAEELAQDTLLQVWRKAAQFDPARAGASTWIFTIARNLRIDAQRRERPVSTAEDPSEAKDLEAPADAVLLAAEREAQVRTALGALPPEQAEIVQLSFFSDEPHSVIAERLKLPLGTVKSRLRLAMGRLRALLEEPA